MTNMQESTKKSRLLNLLKGIGVAVGILVVATIVITLWGFIPGSTTKLEETAKQFKASSEWVLESETINPARNVCLQADCDELRKVWQLEKEISTQKEFQSFAQLDNKNMKISNDNCTLGNTNESSLKICEASATLNSYRITLNYSKYNNEKSTMILNIER